MIKGYAIVSFVSVVSLCSAVIPACSAVIPVLCSDPCVLQ